MTLETLKVQKDGAIEDVVEEAECPSLNGSY